MDEHLNAMASPLHPGERTGFALIMKGGGMKGLAYVGALQELQRYYSFDMYAGTSAGAITAALLGAGYTPDELQKIMFDTEFSKFLPERLRRLTNLIFYGGLYRGLELTDWLDGLLARKLESARKVVLGDLPFAVALYACRRDADAIVFDSNDRKSTPVSYAVRCSMSIPLFFTPEKSEGLNVFDGGMRYNYPVRALLDRYPGKKFIGLYLGDEVYIPRPPSIIRDLINVSYEATDIEALSEHRKSTIIIDPSPISTLNFRLSREEKEFLLLQGRAAARKFLKAQGLVSEQEYNEATTAALAKKRAVEIDQKVSRERKILASIASLAALVVIAFWLASDGGNDKPCSLRDPRTSLRVGEKTAQEVLDSIASVDILRRDEVFKLNYLDRYIPPGGWTGTVESVPVKKGGLCQFTAKEDLTKARVLVNTCEKTCDFLIGDKVVLSGWLISRKDDYIEIGAGRHSIINKRVVGP